MTAPLAERFRTWWDDLSSVELRRRLTQRGVDEQDADDVVSHRDDCPECRAFIHAVIS